MKTKTLTSAVFALFLVIAGSTTTFAQCDKTATLTSTSTDYLDDTGTVLKSNNEQTVITITKTDLTIAPGDHQMSGKITSSTCDWKVPFKDGKTVVKSLMTGDGEDKHVTITIEGKAGKVTLTFEAEEMPGKKIQVVADKFE
ncbi:hypothetical protein ABIB62_003832 [Mucilaginibacter sp. UYP25]|uniref:hypothetical protein n=1 Tax=unclassified Mucilaginibacter TaxID=2617802 RepID=UPI0033975DBA